MGLGVGFEVVLVGMMKTGLVGKTRTMRTKKMMMRRKMKTSNPKMNQRFPSLPPAPTPPLNTLKRKFRKTWKEATCSQTVRGRGITTRKGII